MHLPSLALVAVLLAGSGCAPTVGTAAKLSEAGLVIDRLRPSPDCAGLVTEAREALEYARFEDDVAGQRALVPHRADVALFKAKRAEAACAGVAAR